LNLKESEQYVTFSKKFWKKLNLQELKVASYFLLIYAQIEGY
jgi:hypothetical protein